MDASYIPIAEARGFTTHWINPVSDQQPRIRNNLTIHPLILITQLHNLHISRV